MKEFTMGYFLIVIKICFFIYTLAKTLLLTSNLGFMDHIFEDTRIEWLSFYIGALQTTLDTSMIQVYFDNPRFCCMIT
jgi:hypothetical protein